MASGAEITSQEYIKHHLQNLTVGEGFWSFHIDTLGWSIFLGLVFVLSFRAVAKKATTGIPGKWQCAVEMIVEFVDDSVKSTFHGKNPVIAPLALTIFVWVLLMNTMDILPIDIMAWIYEHVFGLYYWKTVPTTDVNTTFALALSIFFLMIFFSLKVKGFGGWMHELFCTPFALIRWRTIINKECRILSQSTPLETKPSCYSTSVSLL